MKSRYGAFIRTITTNVIGANNLHPTKNIKCSVCVHGGVLYRVWIWHFNDKINGTKFNIKIFTNVV